LETKWRPIIAKASVVADVLAVLVRFEHVGHHLALAQVFYRQ
jgi:hypothetical protein